MGNSNSFKFNTTVKKEDPHKEIYYGPDPEYLPNTNRSVSISGKKNINDGNNSRRLFNEVKKENPYEEIYYGPDPCYLLNTNHRSFSSLSRKKPINDGNISRFKTRSLPPIPYGKTDIAQSYLNYYDSIGNNSESKNRNSSIAMVPKEQVFNINVIFESKNTSRCPSVSTMSTVFMDSIPSSRRNSIVNTENRPTELNFEETISMEDTHIMKFTGFLADV